MTGLKYVDVVADKQSCANKDAAGCIDCPFCYTSAETSIRSRRCFMTGAYCSKQMNIQREQQQLHDQDCITAFVVMNFSDMSDVVYKWRIKPFIESLSKYLYFDDNKQRLYCSNYELNEEKRIKKIRVVRSDTAPSSNYVICSRICQQMQIADLIVVDVSVQNANVFYEFGMAIALGKLILPICYSESFYKITVPPIIKDDLNLTREVEHHIGCYPWRKNLFEFYGIRYKFATSQTCYEEFEKITDAKYGFSDFNYTRFPYHEPLPGDAEIIGKKIYNKLRDEYNGANSTQNTLVVYTMDAFLNEKQAGLCIVNFYHGIVARMRQEKCFCGDRVGILVQENAVREDEKDAKSQLDLSYSVGEIIQIGLNQATYLAMKDKIDAHDSFVKNQKVIPLNENKKEVERFIKGYVRNKGMRIYPNYPVFVDRMKNLLHRDILDSVTTDPKYVCYNSKFFCLYHVMLRTLRYTNEVVVDISGNCLQALFWLGAAHGSDIHAITVMHEKTGGENESYTDREPRHIFDVAGLWTAVFRKNDTEGFYQQLALAQHGIERQSKLMLPDTEFYKSELDEYFSSFNSEHNESKLKDLERSKEKEEKRILESYYRTHFWAPMLCYNQLSIYVSHVNRRDDNGKPRISTAKWDFDAISELSNYLSKRKIIGQYRLTTLDENEAAQTPINGAKETNFICVGSRATPLGAEGPGITNYIKQKMPYISKIHKWVEQEVRHIYDSALIKGFARINNESEGYYTHIPQVQLKDFYTQHPVDENMQPKIIYSTQQAEINNFFQTINGTHYEIAQLVLWREDVSTPYDNSHYWVSIAGSSGPATLALSTILVDERQRERICPSGYKECSCSQDNHINLLYELQAEVRKQFMKYFLKNLIIGMEEIAHKYNQDNADEQEIKRINIYFELVKYAVSFYLQTVLYRYFFPFLSPNDIDRIYNGMYSIVNSMRAANVSPFALEYTANCNNEFDTRISKDIVAEIVDRVPEILRSSIQDFKGLEAFYLIKVEHHLNDEDRDTRKIKTIEMMKDEAGSSQIVNCFISNPDKMKEGKTK